MRTSADNGSNILTCSEALAGGCGATGFVQFETAEVTNQAKQAKPRRSATVCHEHPHPRNDVVEVEGIAMGPHFACRAVICA